MIHKILKHKNQIFLIILAVIGFAVIRNYEDFLFYDPFLNFFKNKASQSPFPQYIEWKLFVSLFL